MQTEINRLAVQMNVKPSDAMAFLTCISGYVSRGMTLEAAIAAHQKVNTHVFETLSKANNEQRRAFVTSAFFA